MSLRRQHLVPAIPAGPEPGAAAGPSEIANEPQEPDPPGRRRRRHSSHANQEPVGSIARALEVSPVDAAVEADSQADQEELADVVAIFQRAVPVLQPEVSS